MEFKQVLSEDKVNDLFSKARYGDAEARRLLIEHNMGLIALAIKKVDFIYDREDAFQDGMIGLINAVDTFDSSIGVKFSSYAVNCIINNIKLATYANANTFKMSAHLIRKYNIYKRVVHKLQNELFREPTSYEIFEEMKLVINKINENNKIKIAIDYKTVKILPILFEGTSSFDYKVKDDSDTELIDLYEDSESCFEDAVDAQHSVKKLIKDANLNEKLEKVIRMRFGFDGYVYTQQEVCEVMGISRARVGQLEKKALEKLRAKYNEFGSSNKTKRR